MNKNTLCWTQKAQKTLCTTPIFTVKQLESISPEGQSGMYVTIDTYDWVIVVPHLVENGIDYFLMVKQWRHASGQLSIEFPGGVIDEGEQSAIAAERELCEETGYTSTHIRHLASINPNPAIMSNTVHFYAAEQLSAVGKQSLDDDEFVECEKIPCAEVYAQMGSGSFHAALMCSALFLYNKHLATIEAEKQ